MARGYGEKQRRKRRGSKIIREKEKEGEGRKVRRKGDERWKVTFWNVTGLTNKDRVLGSFKGMYWF